MRIHTHIKEFSNDDLRILSNMSGKSVRELKRLRETKVYLTYISTADSYGFFGQSVYALPEPYKSPEEFFDTIREHQLAKIL